MQQQVRIQICRRITQRRDNRAHAPIEVRYQFDIRSCRHAFSVAYVASGIFENGLPRRIWRAWRHRCKQLIELVSLKHERARGILRIVSVGSTFRRIRQTRGQMLHREVGIGDARLIVESGGGETEQSGKFDFCPNLPTWVFPFWSGTKLVTPQIPVLPLFAHSAPAFA